MTTKVLTSVDDAQAEFVEPTGGGAVDSVNGQTGVVVLDAGDIAFTPVGTIAGTDTQTAVAEVATDAASALSTHAGAADPHTGYALESALGSLATQSGTFSGTSSGTNTGDQTLGTTAAAVGTSAGGAATSVSKSDHVHATGAGTPSTQAFGDAAATGTGPAAAMTDHKHAMPAAPFISYNTLVGALTGLVHRWKFEEASGNFADSVGSLTLTAAGAFTYAVAGGPVSGASGSVTFGASGKGTSSGLGSIPVAGTARTFLLVYKGKNATAKACFWSYGTAATRAWFTAFINDGVQDTMSMSVFGAGNDVTQALTPGNMETWHLLAGVYDGVQATSLFIDGRVAAIREGAALNTTNSGNFVIGLDISGTNQLLAATYDDLAILNVALDHFTIQRLYAALAGGLP